MIDAGTSLVERDEQLELLRDHVVGSNGSIVLVEGMAGMGKSVLIDEALIGLDDQIDVWCGRCEPVVIPVAFSPFFEMLDDLPPNVAEVVRSGTAGVATYARILDALKHRETVVALDDLQWADEATLDLVRYLGRRIASTRSSLVLGYRPEESGPAADVIADLMPRAHRIVVDPLTVAGVLALGATGEREAERIHSLSGGNPFFASEMIRNPDVAVPATVGEVITAGLRRLPIAAQRLVEAIALCLDGLDVDVALQLSHDAAAHFDLACERGLIATRGDRAHCRHDLMRTAIDDAIPPARRRELHAELLTLREQHQRRTPAAVLAHHAVGAGNDELTLVYSLQAADAAMAAGTHRHAADHIARGRPHFDRLPADERFDALGRAAEVYSLVARFDQAVAISEERVELAGSDTAARAEALALLGSCWDRLGNCGAGLVFAEESLALRSDDSASAAMAHRVAAKAAMHEGDFPLTIEHSIAAAAANRALGNAQNELQSMVTAATAKTMSSLADGLDELEVVYERSLDLALTDVAATAINNLAFGHLDRYEFDAARRWFETGLAHCEQFQLDRWIRSLNNGLATIDLECGRWAEARRYLDEPDVAACWPSEAEVAGLRARLLMRTGDADAPHLVAATIDLLMRDPWLPDRIDAATLLAEAAWLGVADLADVADSIVSEASLPAVRRSPWGSAHIAFWADLAGVELPTTEMGGPMALVASGDREGTAAEWDRLGCTYGAALTRTRLDDPPVDDIVRVLDGLGAIAAIDAVRRDWAARGITTSVVPRHPSGLTRRQLEVLELLVAGCTNAEIADRLYISEKTAGHHVSAILTQLGVNSRRAAAAVARDRHWV